MPIYGYSAADSKATWRGPDPLQWLGLGQFGAEDWHSLSLSFIFLEWGV
jgi:hypothetical protein